MLTVAQIPLYFERSVTHSAAPFYPEVLHIVAIPLHILGMKCLYRSPFPPYLYFVSALYTAACDVTGTTCLHRVAFLGHSVVGELLICGGCPVDAVNKDGDAAIHIAAREVRTYFIMSACCQV